LLLKSSLRQGWLHEAWQRKASLLSGALAILSLSLAHYAGFLMKAPLQIVAVAGLPLAKGVTATFFFYVFFCAVFARVLISMLQLVTLPFFAATDRVEGGLHRKMSWSRQRRFVRSHSQIIKWEGYIWISLQAALFLLIMLGIYVKFTMTWRSSFGLMLSIIFVILSVLVRSGFFLQPKPTIFIKKIQRRPTHSGRAASAAFSTMTAALIIMAFSMGSMRANLLRDEEPHMVVTKEFTGKANIIASAEGALLLFQKQDDEFRYIYSTPEFTASMETKPVFPPISANK
jgi:glucan phosphoethanolaminetransferase (alkaline phosphatase superfamily)